MFSIYFQRFLNVDFKSGYYQISLLNIRDIPRNRYSYGYQNVCAITNLNNSPNINKKKRIKNQ